MTIKGYIFDIKKYSINDGPGIRTTVFFKGCPLNCWWCHNPESQRGEPEKFDGYTYRWNSYDNPDKKNIIGRAVHTNEVMREIEKDIPFYEESKGGVTFSGGEPLLQIEFLFTLLKECKRKDIHTAVDTTGYAPFEYLEKIYDLTDIFLFDLKLMDDEKHIYYTGVSNKIIHENLFMLTAKGTKVIIRIPIIPDITSTDENFDSLIKFISSLRNIKELDLLPFHKSAHSKYAKMNKINKLPHLETVSDEKMDYIKERFSVIGLPVKIGG